MMLMTDSGNESEERVESLFSDNLEKTSELLAEALQTYSDSDAESDIYSKMNEFDVVFHDPKDKSGPQGEDRKELVPKGEFLIDSVAPASTTRRVLTSDNSTESYTSSIGNSSVSTQDSETRPNQKFIQINTCKILQRKLELKVERAKRNYRQMYEEQDSIQDLVPKSAPLIPITRLSIPGSRDYQQPLVDVGPISGETDEDDLEQVSFFPRATKKATGAHKRHELSDTFSIQEMTIESDQEDELDFQQCRKLSDSRKYKKILNRGLSGEEGDYLDNDVDDCEDDDDSQNLELLPPKGGYNVKEWAQRALCCFKRNDFIS
ncbi:uncharacterized protein LOC129763596 [Toxorhynchites rutilus septentrionalis]|uniref:uncharacterized protein LOC129763596 n=1 Tax=Toxorhynchites rutilus septentrionalis TaxID=329112 RepID=UPI00247ACE6A|nr:uncharacterized protein LOC129763596 [Toxorhynchites rutilus septentrionalis]